MAAFRGFYESHKPPPSGYACGIIPRIAMAIKMAIKVSTYYIENSDIPSRWIFFHYEFLLVDWYQKKILLLSHLTYPSFLWGYFSKMLGYSRHARWNGGWIFFVSNSKAFFNGINRLFHAHETCISRTNNSCTTPRE